jgi:hypothetical protein
MHQRKLIRDATVALLANAGTAAGARVTPTRVDAHKKNELPALSVYTLSEQTDADDGSTAPRELWRTLKLEIAGWVAHSAALPADDALDALAEQIEAVMEEGRYLGGTASDSILVSTEVSILSDGDPLLGVITLTYEVSYFTSPAAPDNLDDFLRAGATAQVDGAAVDNAANDVIQVRP